MMWHGQQTKQESFIISISYEEYLKQSIVI